MKNKIVIIISVFLILLLATSTLKENFIPQSGPGWTPWQNAVRQPSINPDKNTEQKEYFPSQYYQSKEKKEKRDEKFLDYTMYNAPAINGFRPSWFSGPSPPSYLSPVGPYGQGAGMGYPQHIPQGAQYAYSNIAYQNAQDRIYNPLRYPYRSQAFYEQGWYPNMSLPPQVIGCGGRTTPCIGGTQTVIPNIFPPIEISNRNIAPVNVSTRGPLGVPQQVGVLYKIFGSLNDALPLFGRKRFPNSDNWDYYTIIGPTGGKIKAKVITRRKNQELGTNDEVMVKGSRAKYKTSMYDSDFPQYIPYA